MREVEAGRESVDQRTRHIEFIRAASQILDLTFDLATIAGENAVEMKRKTRGWGLADSIVLVHARSAKAKVVTGDEHFRDLAEAIFIKDNV